MRKKTFLIVCLLFIPPLLYANQAGEGIPLFVTNHLEKTENVLFINKNSINQCQSINQLCDSEQKKQLIEPSKTTEQNLISNQTKDLVDSQRSNTLSNDVLMQKTAVLPEDFDDYQTKTDSFVFNSSGIADRKTVGSDRVLFINKPSLNHCRNIDQSCYFNQKNAPALNPSKITQQSWMANRTDDFVDSKRLNPFIEALMSQKTAILPESFIEPITDRGFLVRRTNSDMVVTYVGRLKGANMQKHVVNFDGNDLIYYDPNETLAPSRNSRLRSSRDLDRIKLKFSNEGKVLIHKSVKNAILGNLINTAGVVEANHISIKMDHIVLDSKEVRINNLPEKKYYLNQTRYTLQAQPGNSTAENVSRMQKKYH